MEFKGTKMIALLMVLGLMMRSTTGEQRDPKWFIPKGTVTSTVIKRFEVTAFVPSSCFYVDPLLPNCRNVRRVDIQPSKPTRIESTTVPAMMGPRGRRALELEGGEEERASQNSPGWGYNWLWRSGQETVTVTATVTNTLRRVNTDEVVSVMIKGCQPTMVPFNLPPCNASSATNATRHVQRELHYAHE